MQLSPEQLEQLKKHWPLEGEVRFHRRVANFVYFAELGGREVVLRLTEPSHRQMEEIVSELHWIAHLCNHGVRAAGPITAQSGSIVVTLQGEKTYFAVVFEKAAGSFLRDDVDVAPEMLRKWGRFIGKMHRLAKSYRPLQGVRPRQQWQEDESLAMAMRSLDKEDRTPYLRMNELLEWMRTLPQETDGYGLIHTDLHRGNFFVHEDEIIAFDFDDSCYQWFSYDFAAPINSVHKNFYEGGRHVDKDKALELFLEGYRLENQLSAKWIERIAGFDKWRAVLMYHWLKTFTQEGVFDANVVERAKVKGTRLLEILKEPLRLT